MPTAIGINVLHISSERSWRGGEQQIAYLIEESRKMGLNPSVFLRKGSAFQDWAKKEEVPFYAASFSNALDVGSALGLKKAVSEGNIDLIHIHSGKGHDIYALATLFGLTCKAVLSRRVDFPVKSNLWAKWKYNLKSIQRIICVSEAIRTMTAPALKEPSKAITVHSGIDLARFEGVTADAGLRAKYNIPSNYTLIGNVSALAPHKDLSTFVRTAEAFLSKDPEAVFFIVGEGDEREDLTTQIDSTGLQGKVILTGFRTDVPAVLRELDLFLITSKTEGLGTTVLDAFASGTAVVATAAGGIPESVIDGQTGLLCPIGDYIALSAALDRLVNDEELKTELKRNAIKHLAQFTKESTARKTLLIYEEVIADS